MASASTTSARLQQTYSVGGWGETSLDALRLLVRVRSIGLAQHSAQPLLRDCEPRCDGALRDAQRLRDGAVGVAVVVPEHDRGRLLGRQLGQGQREISALDLLLRIRRTLRPAHAPDDLADLAQL